MKTGYTANLRCAAAALQNENFIHSARILSDLATVPSNALGVIPSKERLHEKIKIEIRRGNETQKGDWKPLVFLFTDGKPSDIQLYRDMVPKIKSLDLGALVGCAAGHLADDTLLKELTDTVVHLDSCDSTTLKTFFKWVSDTIEQGNKSQGTGERVALPDPPSEVIVVI